MESNIPDQVQQAGEKAAAEIDRLRKGQAAQPPAAVVQSVDNPATHPTPVTETPAAQPAAPTPDDAERLKTENERLRSELEKQRRDFAARAGKIGGELQRENQALKDQIVRLNSSQAALADELQQLRAQLKPAQQAPVAPQAVEDFVGKEFRETYGDDLADKVQAAVKAGIEADRKARPAADPVNPGAHVEPKPAAEPAVVNENARRVAEYWEQVKAMVPDFDTINGNQALQIPAAPGFAEYLDEVIEIEAVNPLTKKPQKRSLRRREAANSAAASSDVESMVALFNDFRSRVENPAGPVEAQVEPPKVKSVGPGPGNPAKGRVIPKSEMDEFYRTARENPEQLTPATLKAKNDEYIQAAKENRIDFSS